MKDKSIDNQFPQLGYGLGLRPEHFDQVLNGESRVEWFEILAENYMGIPGSGQSPLLKKLLRLRENYPIVFHCVSMNIGSVDKLDYAFLNDLKNLKNLIKPQWLSDHLCFTGINQQNSHELLPLPYTKESIENVSSKILQIQDFFKEKFLIENTSSYITYECSEMNEWEFISEIIKKTGCGLLLDVNNIFVSSQNHNYSPYDFLDGIPLKNVGQIHIAGHRSKESGLLVDTHDEEVCDEVYELIKYLANKTRLPSIMAEWDDSIPDLQTYEKQVLRVKDYLCQKQ